MKPIPSILICLLVGASMGAMWDSVAVKKVREGIRLYAAGDYEAASEAFVAADSADPDNETIAFDRACTLTALGELDQAKDLFQQAALAGDTRLSSDAHFNLGNLAATRAKETLGPDPVNVDPGKREQVISDLLSAAGHYRDCLRIETTHAEARHNLELIRLFIKHIQAEWEQRDRQQARDELGLLDFLAMIERKQQDLRSLPALLAQAKNSPHRRQALREAADSQRQLQEEIEPLKQKIAAELQPPPNQPPAANPQPQQPGGASPQTSAQQLQQVQTLLNQLADEIAELMLKAADQVQGAELDAAQQTQRETLDQLNELFMVIAPFAKVIERAVPLQEHLVQRSETTIQTSGLPANPETEDDSESERTTADEPTASAEAADDNRQLIEPQDAGELAWQQSRITDWGRLLSLKAQIELPQAEAQVETMAAQATQEAERAPADESADAQDPDTGTDENTAAASHDPTAQLKSLVESLKAAIELAPQVEEHSASAEQHLATAALEQALPEQQEALRLLKEIAKPLSEDNQQDQQQQDDENQQQGEQDQDESQQDQRDEPSDGDQPQQDQQQKQQQQQSPSQERAESVLRRAREREREHRELEKELRRILGIASPVDRDW